MSRRRAFIPRNSCGGKKSTLWERPRSRRFTFAEYRFRSRQSSVRILITRLRLPHTSPFWQSEAHVQPQSRCNRWSNTPHLGRQKPLFFAPGRHYRDAATNTSAFKTNPRKSHDARGTLYDTYAPVSVLQLRPTDQRQFYLQ